MVSAADPIPGLRRHADLLAAGDASSSELVELALERIEATQSTLNAFRVVCAEKARAAAVEADRRIAAGERGTLLGVPIAIKDDVDLEGESTPFGTAGEHPRASSDCELVRRLRGAGAVIVGKTTTCEYGLWPIAEGAHGATRNPWSLDHTPGGSSGGAAAAVAGGIVPAAIGSDGAGSVRIPAAWCHLVGIKPQRGRISTWPHAEAFNGLTCYGPLARSVDDAALLLDALVGNHDGDLHKPPPPDEPFAVAARRDPGRLRIALSLKPPWGTWAKLDVEHRAATERVAGALTDLGHDVIAADPPYRVYGIGIFARGPGGLGYWIDRHPDPKLLDPRVRAVARIGKLLGPTMHLARALERPFARRIGSLFEAVDVILTPTTARPPLRIGAMDGLGLWATDGRASSTCPYAWVWNVIGWPGVSVPSGFTASGLPIGAQLLGRRNDEATLLALASQLEAVEHWDQRVAPHAVAQAAAA